MSDNNNYLAKNNLNLDNSFGILLIANKSFILGYTTNN